jgi:hypothetical protein
LGAAAGVGGAVSSGCLPPVGGATVIIVGQGETMPFGGGIALDPITGDVGCGAGVGPGAGAALTGEICVRMY